MNRRAVATLAALLATFAVGYAAGNAPDRELRRAAKDMAGTTYALSKTCREVLSVTVETGLSGLLVKDVLSGRPHGSAEQGQ